ncbi:MAG TPA: helix-turn-helix domain-containing protein, partial [Kiloniellaceae bacterium]|nr:helix-turn-helix domain-containing protein [Kiloniellaceae bacterium]
RLLSIASNELAAAQDQMLLLGRKTAREKIASFLLMLGKRAKQRGQADNPVAVPMSRTDIGDYLGLTTETVSRVLSAFGREKIISVDRSCSLAHVLDVPHLKNIAEGLS